MRFAITVTVHSARIVRIQRMCQQHEQDDELMMGHHYGDLVANWGPPQQVLGDGSDGRILVYTTERQFVAAPATATTTGNYRFRTYDNLIWGTGRTTTTYTPARTYGYSAWRMFWINRGGRVYRWQWKGL